MMIIGNHNLHPIRSLWFVYLLLLLTTSNSISITIKCNQCKWKLDIVFNSSRHFGFSFSFYFFLNPIMSMPLFQSWYWIIQISRSIFFNLNQSKCAVFDAFFFQSLSIFSQTLLHAFTNIQQIHDMKRHWRTSHQIFFFGICISIWSKETYDRKKYRDWDPELLEEGLLYSYPDSVVKASSLQQNHHSIACFLCTRS